MVRKEDVEQARRNRADFVTLEHAASELGLKRQRLSRLLPSLCPEATKDTAHGVPWNIPSSWLHAWTERLKSYATVPAGELEGLACLNHRLRFGGSNDREIADLLLGVQRGEVDVEGVLDGERRVSALLFREDVLRQADEYASLLVAKRWLNAQQLAELLEVKEQVVYHWMRIGLLIVTPFRERGRIVRRVRLGDVERFRSMYALGRDLARELRVSPRGLANDLRKAGVEPLSGPGVDEGRQLVYERAAIAKLSLSQGLVVGRAWSLDGP